MKTFVDNAGRTWAITINVGQVKRVKGFLGIDLYKLLDGGIEKLGELLSDPISFVDVLYVLCKDEADKANVTDEGFGRSLGGDSIKSACDAFLEELVDFFPDPKARESLRKIITKGRIIKDLLLTQALEKIEAVQPSQEVSKLLTSFSSVQES